MPPRTAKQILAEWHELAMRRDATTEPDIADGLAARIAQLRREYIEGTPPEPSDIDPPTTSDIDDEPRIQMELRL
jgi:hypothetical protein